MESSVRSAVVCALEAAVLLTVLMQGVQGGPGTDKSGMKPLFTTGVLQPPLRSSNSDECPNPTCPPGCAEGGINITFTGQRCPRFCACKECSGVITDKKANIISPNYPNNYPDDVLCIWVYRPPVGSTDLTVQFFKPFKVESELLYLDYEGFIEYEDPEPGTNPIDCFDAAIVFDGPTTNSPVLGQAYCGVNAPPTLQGTQQEIVFAFVSDFFLTFEGFQAQLSSCPSKTCPTRRQCPSKQTQRIVDEHGCDVCVCKPCPEPVCPKYCKEIMIIPRFRQCDRCVCKDARKSKPYYGYSHSYSGGYSGNSYGRY